MPTTSRRRWCIPWAVEYFLRQSYVDSDLLIVGDGESVADLVPEHPRVSYLHLEDTPRLGAKFNICCDRAEGPWIALWADDDWQASWRLTYTMAVLGENPKAQLAAKNRSLIHNIAEDQTYLYENKSRWFGSGSAVFTKTFWKQRRFPEQLKRGVDTVWMNDFSPDDWRTKIKILPGWLFYVAIDHGANTGRSSTYCDKMFSKWPGDVAELIGDDWDRYRRLRD